MVSFKSQCIQLRERGFSLSKIIAITKRPKSSVYFHIKNIPLSKKRVSEIKRAAIRRITAYSKSIKGKSKLDRHPIPFSKWNKDNVSLVAHLIFDGEIKSNGCSYTNRNIVLIEQVKKAMQKIYPFPPKEYESFPGVHKIDYYNVELERFFKDKARELISNIQRTKIELQRTFLRAFFDDEGSLYWIKNKRAVRGYQHNHKILLLVQRLLKGLGIKSKVDKKYNEVTITRVENIKRFAKEINFSKGVCVNGNRSNSVWKKSLEKRTLLQKAIASYQH